ncbi:MAG: response regulator [Candidatus Omnitrophota bacterium]|jgi:two-component system response regulator VicR
MAKKILVVDDNKDIVRLISSRLTANNYDVITAFDSLLVMQLALKEKPDLIILDNWLPCGTGLNLTEKLKKTPKTANIPIILITAQAGTTIRDLALELGAVDFIGKPFEAGDMLKKVKKALGE